MTRDEWYLEMGQLIKARERAQTMINTWTEKLTGTEQAIEVLRDDTGAPEVMAPVVDAEAAATEE